LLALFLKFLKFGFLAWGGPVAQIGMLRHELVEKEQWISPEKFNRALSVYQVLPGPEAHEMCVYLGSVRAGRIGGLLAGLGFMLPGLFLILLLSWAYMQVGAAVLLPLLVGFKPAVAALVVRAVHRLGSHALHERMLIVSCLITIALVLAGAHFLVALILSGVWWVLYHQHRQVAWLVLAIILIAAALFWLNLNQNAIVQAHGAQEHSLAGLFTEGLKAGLLTFGGAYTVIPFLEQSLVSDAGPITPQLFMDAIALSSVIPAPLVIFATMLGYAAQGLAGALLITLGIFLPAFGFTLIGHSTLERLIEYKPLHRFLDGVTAGVIGLLAITAVMLFLNSVTSLESTVLFGIALAVLFVSKSKWIIPAVVLGSGAIGYFLL
jgi:chromate transporter